MATLGERTQTHEETTSVQTVDQEEMGDTAIERIATRSGQAKTERGQNAYKSNPPNSVLTPLSPPHPLPSSHSASALHSGPHCTQQRHPSPYTTVGHPDGMVVHLPTGRPTRTR